MTLSDVAKKLLKDRKGVLAFDQSDDELAAEFLSSGFSPTSETINDYRELILSLDTIDSYISGVTLSAAALKDSHASFGKFSDYVRSRNILIGVEVETRESDADALTKIPSRLDEAGASGVSFAEWRLFISSLSLPASESTKESIRARIEFVKLCQSKNILPVVEIDVNMDGSHSAAETEDMLVEILSLLADGLESGGVDLRGVIVKTSMCVSGIHATVRADAKEVGERTVRAVTSTLPASLGGVLFLSGMQKPEEAVGNLNWIARHEPFSWPIAFSFTDALLQPALSAWRGKEDNRSDAHTALLERLTLAQSADGGGYSAGMEESSLQKL